jgi:hypothetical protein
MSLNLGHHISDLLYHHDCVIVPDLGGFVANAQSASISVQAHTVAPPSKQIGFNQNLIQNDGLLANALVQKEGLEYNEAVQQLLAKARQYKDDLKQGRRVELLKVGVLYRDRSGNVRFVPNEDENHLKTSFGLGKLYLVPIGTEVAPVEVVVEEKVTPVVPITTETTEKRTRKLPRIVKVAAVVLPLLLVGGWLLRDEISNAKSTNFASLNPFKTTTVPSSFAPRFEEEDIAMDYPADENTIDVLADSNPDLTSVYFSFEEDKLTPDGILVNIRNGIAEDPAAAIPVTPNATAIPAATKMKMWFIVGGAFREKSNADNMASSLRNKGYEAYIFGKKNDLHLVCYGSYTNKQSASQALTDVRTKENKHAWLKKH